MREGFVAGIDLSDEMVRMATRRCRRLIEEGRVRLAVADAVNIPYPDSFFDKAYTVHTIYFWDEPGRHLRELGRVLRDGGRLVLGCHANKEIVAAAFPASVYTFYSTDEVRRLLEQTGFDHIEVEHSADGVALAVAERRGRA